MTDVVCPQLKHVPLQPLILVVDDEAFMRSVITDALDSCGLGVVAVSSGQEMLETLGNTIPDAVVLDVVMPEMDGYQACERLRTLPGCEHLPVLMVTGKDDLESIDRAFAVGATDFMAKPVNGPIMAYRLRYLLRSAETARSLRSSEQYLARAQKIARLGYWHFDPLQARLQVSEMAAKLLDLEQGGWYAPREALVHVDEDEQPVLSGLLETLQNAGEVEPCFFRVSSGSDKARVLRATWEQRENSTESISGVLQDVTEITRARERIEYLAYFDELTGLANRNLFLERVREALASATRHERIGALLYLDVHHFKRINDTLGLEVGDCLLQEVALRLRRFVRECDVLALNPFDEGRVSRLGGDEFCILLSEVARPDDAAQVVQRLDQVMREPFLLGEQQVHITLRTGISVFPADGEEPEELLKQAYTALSYAKDTSGAYQFYEQSMTEAAVSRMQLEQEIRRAIDQNHFTLFYQPLIDLKSGRVIGVEALARWQHPRRGTISPVEFIPVAEDSGLIVPMGRALVREACRQASAWLAQGYPPLRMSVNISPRQFIDDDVCALLEGALGETGLPPENLEVEVTESLLLDDASQADATLQQLKRMGIGVAIDDFGTGYSSLSYLHAFPIDTLKIDRSFVNNGTEGGQAEAILRAIIAMGQSLEMNILAEGIETEAQRQLLTGLGCHEAQGYLFGKPLPAAEVEVLFGLQKGSA